MFYWSTWADTYLSKKFICNQFVPETRNNYGNHQSQPYNFAAERLISGMLFLMKTCIFSIHWSKLELVCRLGFKITVVLLYITKICTFIPLLPSSLNVMLVFQMRHAILLHLKIKIWWQNYRDYTVEPETLHDNLRVTQVVLYHTSIYNYSSLKSTMVCLAIIMECIT